MTAQGPWAGGRQDSAQESPTGLRAQTREQGCSHTRWPTSTLPHGGSVLLFPFEGRQLREFSEQ